METTGGLKQGIRTSEFWLSVITALFVMLNRLLGIDLNVETLAPAVATIIAYVVSRGIAKGGQL